MKLASLKEGGPDGTLVVVRRDGSALARATGVASTMQAALDGWEAIEPRLRALSEKLERGQAPSEPLDPARLASPLPRAYEWIDGSAYINHIVLVRKARGAEPPKTLREDPLVYQGGSGVLLGPRDDVPLVDPAFGLDFESEVAVVLGPVPIGAKKADAARHVRLVMLVNDWTLRNLVPRELEKGFGFFQSKPASAFSPFAVTPDELGPHFREGRVHLPLETRKNGELVGDPDAGPEMHFSFFDLVEHVAKTRAFAPGTILGSGTVSNADPARGVSCLAERRAREMIESGAPKTPFLGAGDRVRVEMRLPGGESIFGAIEQKVVPA